MKIRSTFTVMFALHPRTEVYACRENLPKVPAEIEYRLAAQLLVSCWEANRITFR